MNKTEITLSMETEKLDALAYFLAKENTTPQKTLAGTLEELYQTHVPEAMREYIESRAAAPAARPRPKRSAKPARKSAENVVMQMEEESDGQP